MIYQEPVADPLYEAVLTALDIRTGMKLLDVACGSGLAVQRAAARGTICTGMDASAQLLEIAAVELRMQGRPGHPGPWPDVLLRLLQEFRGYVQNPHAQPDPQGS